VRDNVRVHSIWVVFEPFFLSEHFCDERPIALRLRLFPTIVHMTAKLSYQDAYF
jgi:hypothetical protein